MTKIFSLIKRIQPFLNDFRILQFVTWSAVGCFNPFIVVFLLHKGLDTKMIGTILMFNSMVTLVAQPLWGMVSDRLRSVKKVFLLCLSVSVVMVLSLPHYTHILVLAFLFPLIMFFFSAVGPLLDSWTLQGLKAEGSGSYGSMRLWGSVGFSVMVILIGRLMNTVSIHASFYLHGIMSILTIIIALQFTVGSTGATGGNADKPPSKRLQPGRLFRNYHYVTFVICACFLFMTMSSVYSFLPKLMKQVGGNDELFGIATAVSAFSEVPVLYFSHRLVRKYKPLALILAAILVYAARLFLYSIAPSPLVIILVQALQGLSYGLFLTGSVYYIDFLAPEELKATAQTTANAIYFGLSGIVGNYGTGYLMDKFGVFFVYRLGACIDIMVFFIFILSLWIGKRVKTGSLYAAS